LISEPDKKSVLFYCNDCIYSIIISVSKLYIASFVKLYIMGVVSGLVAFLDFKSSGRATPCGGFDSHLLPPLICVKGGKGGFSLLA